MAGEPGDLNPQAMSMRVNPSRPVAKAVDDIDRLSDFLLDSDPSTASKTAVSWSAVFDPERSSPDRPPSGTRFRELPNLTWRTGYVALSDST